jgi:N-methylhydantoinase A/oxoprolinase/acetone carboxylase beta subunit
VLLDEQTIRAHKVRSTPDDPSRVMLAGIREQAHAGGVRDVVRGSTVANMALLERRGRTRRARGDRRLRGRAAHRTTDAARALVADRQPLLEDGLTLGMRERLAFDGSVVEPLKESDLSIGCGEGTIREKCCTTPR